MVGWRRVSLPPNCDLPDHCRGSRPRLQLGHDLFDPALGLVDGALEDPLPVPGREMRGQHGDAAQVKAAVTGQPLFDLSDWRV
jgi:hypothetical protein